MKRRTLIIGASGQLGHSAVAMFAGDDDVTALSRGELDVTDAGAVAAVVDRVQPALILNASAYTNVDRAEDEPALALAVNAMAVRSLARAATRVDATLVHYSTDFVFDGTIDRPYREDDAPNPRATYAMSKLLGEWFAAQTARHYVVRVESLFGGAPAQSSIDRILDTLTQGQPVRAFVDRAVSPSFVPDVLAATRALVDGQAPAGLYHCVNSGWTNWAALARELARLVGRPDAVIEETRMADAKLRAPRPLFAALSNDKLATVGVAMPTWQQALEQYVSSRR